MLTMGAAVRHVMIRVTTITVNGTGELDDDKDVDSL